MCIEHSPVKWQTIGTTEFEQTNQFVNDDKLTPYAFQNRIF